ncbi:lipopolysaccharide transport periplasmic protein LptA [Rhodoferax koreense]|uniref:Lipopolysaccharide export system protein LptA n=1 Tax=Rhodoferax koreensis TaxID=1842727 RepID=A0A1P8K293_9BURK|nr:lipopolysaccharide transport periplasmic protein LptA [Rhodoferax koreense]APW40128.1 lipopolysaccharide transport periplasmic protein LptA [Rhodoferax koreense]
MKKNYFYLLLCLVLALTGGFANAEKADRDKPMNVEADNMRYDDLKQTNVFTGRVVMTKGTIIVRGARIDVRQDAAGYQYGVVTAEPGKLAYFRQKRDNVDEFIEGEAETIEYDSKADNVKLIKRAVMRRYIGATLGDETTGAVIVYENTTGVYTVDGNAAPAGQANGGGGGRVRAMLSPKPAASAPTPPATPGPALRPSLRLDGVAK